MIKILKTMDFLRKRLHILGTKLVYSVLLMVYAYQSSRTPAWAKRIIIGALAYLLSPIDSIPDLTPLLGFSDDLGVISVALVTIARYIDEDVRNKAKAKTLKIFKNANAEDIAFVDSKL